MPLSDPIFIQCRKVAAQGGSRHRALLLSAGGAISMSLLEQGNGLEVGFGLIPSLITHSTLSGLAWADAGHTVGLLVTGVGLAGWNSGGDPVTIDPATVGGGGGGGSFPEEHEQGRLSDFEVDDNTPTVLQFDSTPLNEDSTNLDWDGTEHAINVKVAGTYIFQASGMAIGLSTTTRTGIYCRMQKWNGSTWTTILGGERLSYTRQQTFGSSWSMRRRLSMEIGDKIRIQVERHGFSGTVRVGNRHVVMSGMKVD